MEKKVEVRVLGNFWEDLREAALNTVGKELSHKEYNSETMQKYLLSEHSPIRSVILRIKLIQIDYYTSVHFTRHGMSTHYVTTSRPDKTGVGRDVKQKVDHIMDCNLQNIIDMMRKRLCRGKCSSETYFWAVAIKREIEKLFPDIAFCLVPNCVYRSGCPEFSSCGLNSFLLEYGKMLY